MHRKALIVIVVTVTLGALFGCRKPEDRVVATVGKFKITAGEVERVYSPRVNQSDEERLEEKKRILDTLIKDKLFLSEAEAKGYADDEELKNMLEDRKRIWVVNQLYEVEVVQKAKVSPSELREVYDMMCTQLDLKHILVESEEKAKTIRDSLMAGVDFDSLAKRYSTDTATKDKGGALGWTTWPRLPDELIYAAYDLEQDEISAPIESDRGWHILKYVGTKSVELIKSFDEEKKRIESMIKPRKMKALADAYLEKIKERTDIKYNDDVVKSVVEKAPQQQMTPWSQAPLPSVTDAERELVLATTSKGEWTVGKVLDEAQKMPPRTPLSTPEALKQWTDMLILQDALVDEGLRRRLDRAEAVRKQIDHAYSAQMVANIRRDEIDAKSEPTEEEIEAEFEVNKAKYATPERNHVSVIVTATQKQAQDVLKSLKRGADFGKLAEQKSIHTSKRSQGKLGIANERREPEIFEAAKELKVRSLSGPIKVKDGWAIIKVTKREPMEMHTLDEVRTRVVRDVKTEKIRKIEDEFIAKLRDKYPVTIHEQVLAEVGKKAEQALVEPEKEKKELQ